jgi:hypothetical protein
MQAHTLTRQAHAHAKASAQKRSILTGVGDVAEHGPDFFAAVVELGHGAISVGHAGCDVRERRGTSWSLKDEPSEEYKSGFPHFENNTPAAAAQSR